MNITAPTFEWLELAPVLIVLTAAILGVVIEAAVPRAYRLVSQVGLMVVSLVAALAVLVENFVSQRSGTLVSASMVLDGPAYLAWAALLVFGLLSMLLFAERRLGNGSTAFAASAAAVPGSVSESEAAVAQHEHTEVFPLALFSLSGMLVFAAANDLLTAFVALEVMSLPLYLLSAMARRRRLLSQEAALKYFLLGALSSAFFLFGIALVYGYAGSFGFRDIATSIGAPVYGDGLLLTGMGFLAIGLLFKIGAVPFHNWVPDVYVGAPSPVTGFMAICTKFAAVMAVVRVFYVALGAERWSWQPLIAAIAVLTMVVGVVIAVAQTDIKRLLAYSSISHAGFILVAVVGASVGTAAGASSSLASIVFYLVAYGFATVASFAAVTMVRDAAGEVHSITGWSGLARRNPFLASVVALAMLSFAGIPLTGGFIGKWAVFTAAWRGGYSWLVAVAIVASVVAAYVYFKVIIAMFFGEPVAGVEVGKASGFTLVPLVVGAAATLYLGLFPGQLLDLATAVGTFLR